MRSVATGSDEDDEDEEEGVEEEEEDASSEYVRGTKVFGSVSSSGAKTFA